MTSQQQPQQNKNKAKNKIYQNNEEMLKIKILRELVRKIFYGKQPKIMIGINGQHTQQEK